MALVAALALAAASSCSIKRFAIQRLGDAVAESGSAYASDDDPDLVKDAIPYALKLIESLIDQSPRHRGLLLAATSGFTQYAYAFVREDADETEDKDLVAATALRVRARRLCQRARRYGLRDLEVAHPGFGEGLRSGREAALRQADVKDVPALYWTSAAWGGAIALAKDDPEMVADLSLVEALLRRALELDPDYDSGAIHELLITYEGGRSSSMGGSIERAREHFERARALSGGLRASTFLALAESVSVGTQNRPEFESLLRRALAIDPDAKPEWRLANLVMQRRARWLLARADALFVE